jgi:hypothetical protein
MISRVRELQSSKAAFISADGINQAQKNGKKKKRNCLTLTYNNYL